MSEREPAAGDQGWRDRLLDERTARLARRQGDEAAVPESEAPRILLCRIGTETHGVALDAVEAVMPFRGATPIPGATPGIRGLINRHGRLYRVLDPALLLGVPPGDPAQTDSGGQHLVLLRAASAAGDRIALLVERAETASALAAIPAPDGSGGSHHTTESGQAIALLDLDRLLTRLTRNRT